MPPFRSGRSGVRVATGSFFALALVCSEAAAGPEKSPAKAEATPKNSLAGIPLPIGQEAKGLVLPDFDAEGHLRARFEAGAAKRIDAERVEMKALKMTTYTAANTIDLMIEMPVSTLDLTTRVITSHERTTVARADFNISGDTMQFDTVAQKGTLVGNVKMVITEQSQLLGKAAE